MTPRRLFRTLRAFHRDEQGAVALLFGVMAVMLVMIVGVATDVGNAYRIRTALQESLDAAMLSTAANPTEDIEEVRRQVRRFFEGNLTGAVGEGTVTITELRVRQITPTNVMHADLTATSQTFFGGILQRETLTYSLTSTVQRAAPAEVAIVMSEGGAGDSQFDPFQAMSKLDVQKRVASDLVRTVLSWPDNRVAVVPFSSLVNIDVSGGKGQVPWWVEIQNKPKPEGTGRPDGWTGCVGFRPVDSGYPDSGTPEYDPYFYRTTIDQLTLQKYPGYLMRPGGSSWADWAVANELSSNPYCVTPVIPLYDRSRQQALLKRIDAMYAPTANSNAPLGEDNIALGLLWGWHMLDPAVPFQARTKQEVERIGGKKVIVLVTLENSLNADHHLSYFDGQSRRYQNKPEAQDAYRLMKELCENIKKDGIIIYIVKPPWYDPGDRPLYNDCASSPATDLVFNQPDRADPYDPGREGSIMYSFREIGRQLTEPRLIPCPEEFCPPS